MEKWDAYTEARDQIFAATHASAAAPWIVVKSNDKERARLKIIRHVLATLDHAGKDPATVREPDPLILGIGPNQLG